MRTTMTLSSNMNCNPFVIFDRDMDEVIMLLNFYIELEDTENEKNIKKNKASTKNDGFWDM